MTDEAWQHVCIATPDGVQVRVKVVPGASRSKIAGMLGDRLKVAVQAPPEGGKANKAVCELLAKTLNVPPRDVSVIAGTTQPLKTIEVLGISLCDTVERLSQG
jgi:uncharacterized protein (TIGR00251 family)